MGPRVKSSTVSPGSCGSCGIHGCDFNAEEILCRVPLGREAWLLDEVWPEFDAYLASRDAESPLVFGAWSGSLVSLPNYRWPSVGQRKIIASRYLTLRRALKMRGSRWSGGRRQAILEEFDRRQAAFFARKLPYNVVRLVFWQNFTAFLQRDKTLGGRQFDILMWRAPRHVLQETLNRAASLYPESATLRDFRSDAALVEAERAAFENANRLITPHRDLARLYPHKTTVIDWKWPDVAPRGIGPKVVFLGPTVGRRGAYVMREAARKLALPLVVIGRNLESPDFWKGIDVEERPPGPDCLHEAGLVISPAITDFKPRLLMRALRMGVPVITTPACGLSPMEGLHFTDAFDGNALAEKIRMLTPR